MRCSRILEDSKKNKKSKWWETTRKYMNCAQIEEREIKDRTAKEIRGKVAKVVEEEWREELEKKNSLGLNRRFKKEMKKEDCSVFLESVVWLRARTNSLNLGENSWQINREIRVGCSEERETFEHFILHCPWWEDWRIESTTQVLAQTQNRRNSPSPWRIHVRRTRKENAIKDVECMTETNQKQPREC